MTATTYTPGPWRIETGGDGHRICADVGPQKLKATIATAHGMRPHDAHLISASPLIYAALARYVADYDPESPPDDMPDAGCIECTAGTVPNHRNTGLCKYHQARAALAKAVSKS